jgi:hypothetical protein
MATKQAVLDEVEHDYSELKKAYDEGDLKTRLALDGPLNDLEEIILAAISAGWAKRTEQAKKLSQELSHVTDEINDFKKAVTHIKETIQLAAGIISLLTALAAKM